jgi:predicted transcriptional regulator
MIAERVLEFATKRLRITANDVHRELGMSISNSNNYLRDLWVIGFLNRECQNLSTGGGREFIYLRKL